MAKVTGIGGVFFSSRDPKGLSAWYEKHLGMALEAWGGAVLKWPLDTAEDEGLTVWNVAQEGTDWFAPGKSFMINYRVDDLVALIAELEAADVEIAKAIESHENGKFAWIADPDGNKVELWEPMIWDDKNKEA